MQATFPGVEFLRILFRFKNRKENSSSYVHVLQITWCRAVVLIIKTIVFFWSRRCGPRRSCLSSLLLSQKNLFRFKNRKENSSSYVHVLQITWCRAVVLIIKTIVFLKSSLWSSSKLLKLSIIESEKLIQVQKQEGKFVVVCSRPPDYVMQSCCFNH